MADSLHVQVNGKPAGTLFREQERFVFRYSENTINDSFVSLTMPVRVRDYSHIQLHPIFEMNLPEGYLLALIKKQFAKLTATDDMGILKLLAGSVRGRLHYETIQTSKSPLQLDDLLHSKESALFDELVQRFALQSPLSGVQPKVLLSIQDKATLRIEDYIVKAWGSDYPELALNEYWCMKVLQYAGIPVPEFYCSDNKALFITKRFDLLDDGRELGFEDMCVLQARQRDDKYEGSYEQVAKSLKTFVSPELKAKSLQQFFKMMVLNNILQNGDAHLKNFGVLYDDKRRVWLAPAYDVLSTTAYIKNDQSALTMMGSRKWWTRAHLLRFGTEVCDLTPKQANNLFDECITALKLTALDVEQNLSTISDEEQVLVLTHLLKLMQV